MAQWVKNLPVNAEAIRDMGSIAGSGRFPGERNGNPFQYYCLENPIDRRAWITRPARSPMVKKHWYLKILPIHLKIFLFKGRCKFWN